MAEKKFAKCFFSPWVIPVTAPEYNHKWTIFEGWLFQSVVTACVVILWADFVFVTSSARSYCFSSEIRGMRKHLIFETKNWQPLTNTSDLCNSTCVLRRLCPPLWGFAWALAWFLRCCAVGARRKRCVQPAEC